MQDLAKGSPRDAMNLIIRQAGARSHILLTKIGTGCRAFVHTVVANPVFLNNEIELGF